MSKDKPVIIIKRIKKAAHAGGHGGAWKVAYADFVTAMMAFFLLLWLLSSSSNKKLQGVADYFTPTVGVSGQMGIGIKGGVNPNYKEGVNISDSSSDAIIYGAPIGGSELQAPQSVSMLDMQDNDNFSSVFKDIKEELNTDPLIRDIASNVMIDMTPEGLRIQIMDDSNKPMFKPSTNELQPYIKKLLAVLGKILKLIPNYISISGHTRKEETHTKNVTDLSQDKWLLSALRANVVRSFLSDGYINPEQIIKVVGRADTEPLDINDPSSLRNIRISIILIKSSLVNIQNQTIPVKVIK